MIETALKIICAIMMLEFFRALIESFLDDDEGIKEYYRYCEGCPNGFCTFDPKSKDCIKWEEEHFEEED